MLPTEFAGKRVTVMGIGLFGGGVGVARFLARQGAHVTATDLKDAATLAPSIAQLAGLPIALHLGGHTPADFTDADLVVVNPAVGDDSPYLALARNAGVQLETEINLFFKLCPAPILGITGSNGKSTATALAAHLLEAGPRRVWLGGNIGRSLLEDLDAIRPGDLVVLELSSFQLERLAWTGLSPALSVVLNLSPNHLDRHKTFEAYARAKQPIILNQRDTDAAILNADCEHVSTWGALGAGRKLFFSTRRPVERGAWRDGPRALWRDGGSPQELFRGGDLMLRGEHNLGNALAAAAAAVLCGVPIEAIAPRLAAFKPLEHRLEFVRTLDGVAYYNDSKATTPEAGIAGVEAFDEPVVLIAGGYDKHLPFDKFAEAVVKRAKAAVLIGATAARIRDAIAATGPAPITHVVTVPTLSDAAATLAEAIATARALARPGDVVLLSPACASYDMFDNFEQRGALFKRLVMELSPAH
mgnify:CR=1 FL=1